MVFTCGLLKKKVALSSDNLGLLPNKGRLSKGHKGAILLCFFLRKNEKS